MSEKVSEPTRLQLVALERHLRKVLPKLQETTSWIEKRAGYEKDFANLIGASLVQSTGGERRHWDCEWNELRIELKKGKAHAWLDLTRYSEHILQKPDQEIATLFLFYSEDKKLTSICAVSMQKLLNLLRLDEVIAKQILDLSERLAPERRTKLNFQSRLTKGEVQTKENREFEIKV